MILQSYVGRNIKKLRLEQNLTLAKLGRMIGSNKSYIWKLENETPLNPSLDKLQKIADVLGVSVGHLIQNNPDHKLAADRQEFLEEVSRLDEKTFQMMRHFLKSVA